MSDQEINQFSSDVDKLLSDINNCCAKIAERDGFKLPEVGGWAKKDDGYWDFVKGEGGYVKKDGEWQWLKRGDNPQ